MIVAVALFELEGESEEPLGLVQFAAVDRPHALVVVAVGLRPAQVVVASSLVAATAEVLGSTDLLLCSLSQADELDLHWRPVGELNLVRGYDVMAGVREDAQRIRSLPLGHCLGER